MGRRVHGEINPFSWTTLSLVCSRSTSAHARTELQRQDWPVKLINPRRVPSVTQASSLRVAAKPASRRSAALCRTAAWRKERLLSPQRTNTPSQLAGQVAKTELLLCARAIDRGVD